MHGPHPVQLGKEAETQQQSPKTPLRQPRWAVMHHPVPSPHPSWA